MARHIAWVLTGLLVASAVPAGAAEACGGAPLHPVVAAAPQGHGQQPFKFWVNWRTELGITDQQAAAIEQLWQNNLPELRADRERLDRLESALSQLMHDGADEPAVSAQIDRVEEVRSAMSKARTLMLYRMNRVLTADQRTKLKAMHDKWEASRRGGKL
ncbi:MAG TPA: Spy/CpxP family protein refolding chaperone [Vicinamibacterales bacterium]|nr:Spy/CpxP family protein refolding chaperone [Vicinamibacterales bacterium]